MYVGLVQSQPARGISGKVNVEKRTEQNWVYHLHQTAELECSSVNLRLNDIPTVMYHIPR